jgi:hypothetical protein
MNMIRPTNFSSYMIHSWDNSGAKALSRQTIKTFELFIKKIPDHHLNYSMALGDDGSICLEWEFVYLDFLEKIIHLFIFSEGRKTKRQASIDDHNEILSLLIAELNEVN